MNWPNFTSFVRIGLIPVVIALYYSGIAYAHLFAAILFGIASFTDWLDGYLARKFNQTSEFGAFLDPVADKLLIVVVLLVLVTVYPAILLATIIIIARELLISALREWMAIRGKHDTVKVAFSGKLKTTVQLIAISLLLLCTPTTPEWIWQTGYILIYLAALLSLYSMFHYFKNAWGTLFPKP